MVTTGLSGHHSHKDLFDFLELSENAGDTRWLLGRLNALLRSTSAQCSSDVEARARLLFNRGWGILTGHRGFKEYWQDIQPSLLAQNIREEIFRRKEVILVDDRCPPLQLLAGLNVKVRAPYRNDLQAVVASGKVSLKKCHWIELSEPRGTVGNVIDSLNVPSQDTCYQRRCMTITEACAALVQGRLPTGSVSVCLAGNQFEAGERRTWFLESLANKEWHLTTIALNAAAPPYWYWPQVSGAPHIIDCTAPPAFPDSTQGWTIVTSDGTSSLIWDPEEFMLHAASDQRKGQRMRGHRVREELPHHVLDARALDYLLGHQYLIPKKWERGVKGDPQSIFFWGTLYRSHGNEPVVRGMQFSEGGWRPCFKRLSDMFSPLDVAIAPVDQGL